MFNKVDSKYNWIELKKFVQDSLKNEMTGHDYDHVNRVLKNAMLISRDLSINYNILLASILLHDISFKEGGPSKTHHIKSAEIARSILPDYGFESALIKNISHAILNHNRSFSPYDKIEDLTIEAKVLYDADTLDALGVIGLIRMISFSINQKIPYYKSAEDSLNVSFFGNINFLKQMKENLILDNSKLIANKRMKIIDEFLEQMKKELVSF